MLEVVINEKKYVVFEGGEAVSLTDIETLEEQLGAKLPSQLKSYYQLVDGGLPCQLEYADLDGALWVPLQWNPDAEAAYVGEAASSEGMFKIKGKHASFLRTWQDFRGRIPEGFLPFGNDPGGSLFLIGLEGDNAGKIFLWERHYEANTEAGEVPSMDNIAYICDSFYAFIELMRPEPEEGEDLGDYVRRVWGD
jgi:hypothetical protein